MRQLHIKRSSLSIAKFAAAALTPMRTYRRQVVRKDTEAHGENRGEGQSSISNLQLETWSHAAFRPQSLHLILLRYVSSKEVKHKSNWIRIIVRVIIPFCLAMFECPAQFSKNTLEKDENARRSGVCVT